MSKKELEDQRRKLTADLREAEDTVASLKGQLAEVDEKLETHGGEKTLERFLAERDKAAKAAPNPLAA